MQMSNYTCRKATLSDSTAEIARLIHLTDPYIYPTICSDPEDPQWIALIEDCLKTPDNIFNIENISVVLFQNRIVGVSCVIPCGKRLNFTENIQLPKALASCIQQSLSGYFAPLIAESTEFEGCNITNLCVDAQHRGKGIGTLLMSHCLAEHGRQPIHLDVIASNRHAVQLYTASGFLVESEYLGFSGTGMDLPCFHMLYLPTKP